MKKTVKAYRVTVTEAWSIDEVGEGYSWRPWGANTRAYRGSDQEVQVGVPNGAELAESESGELLLYHEGSAYTCNEALAAGVASFLGGGGSSA